MESAIYGLAIRTAVIDNPVAVFGIGDVIRKLRREKGWTLEELAERSGLNKGTLSGLERGEVDARASTLQKIAAAFGLESLPLPRNVTSSVTAASTDRPQDEELLDVSGYERFSIPVIAEGDASPEGTFWDDAGVKLIEADEWMSRPNDPAVKDPRCYGVRVRGDSMEPLLKPGMRVIVSPNLAVDDGALSYVQLTSGERLIKVVHKQPGGLTLESYNRAYAPRYVALDDVKAVHRIAYIRTLR